MKKYHIKKTEFTPEVIIDCDKGTININGICIPENPDTFFDPIFKQIDCITQSNSQIVFDIYLEYFNTGASKALMEIFLKLKAAEKNDTKVKWKVDKDDDDIKESGEIFQELSKLSFEFIIV
jgi:hypothetical protein